MCLGVPVHQEPTRWQELVPYGKPAAERELQGFGTARVAETRKKTLFFFPFPKSGLVLRCQRGRVCHAC